MITVGQPDDIFVSLGNHVYSLEYKWNFAEM